MKLTFGVGVKDNTEPLVKKEFINNKWVKSWTCPYYSKWKDMLMRCYSDKFQEKHPTYKGCLVCDEWLVFSNFKKWMINQDWVDKHLDKDIKIPNNKIYSPDTCLFVPPKLNLFMCNNRKGLLGVNYHKRDKVFGANVNNPITGKIEFLGNFKSESEAHHAWKARKLQLLQDLCISLKVDVDIYEACVDNILQI